MIRYKHIKSWLVGWSEVSQCLFVVHWPPPVQSAEIQSQLSPRSRRIPSLSFLFSHSMNLSLQQRITLEVKPRRGDLLWCALAEMKSFKDTDDAADGTLTRIHWRHSVLNLTAMHAGLYDATVLVKSLDGPSWWHGDINISSILPICEKLRITTLT